MVLERGPAEPSDMPMPARVVTPGLFLRLAAGLVPTLEGVNEALGGMIVQVAPFVDRELGSAFNADVAPAADSVGQIDDEAEGQTVAELAGALGYVADAADTERRDLPYPDQTEPEDALNLPIEPEVTEGSGGHDGGPEAD